MIKENVYITLKDVLYKRFVLDKNYVSSELKEIVWNGKKNTIKIDLYKECRILNINDKIKLIYIPIDSNIFIYDDLVDVTKNPLFKIENILNGSLVFSDTIIEGADGVGKTTIATSLAQQGIIVKDRCVENISKIMSDEMLQSKRNEIIEKFVKSNPNQKIVVIYMSDENEMWKRICSRERISEYDKKAIETQKHYLESFNRLKDYKNVFLVNCLNKTREDMFEIVKKITIGNNTKKFDCV
ncbi:MAG: hypothetical protein WCR30_00110 [Clostridia bacterium]